MGEYKELLKLARDAIENKLNHKELVVNGDIKKKYSENLACFVTLTLNNDLRGCIGSLIARQELYLDIIENAKNAAFNDYRFLPVPIDDLEKIKIEISILSKPIILGIGELVFDKINSKMGIILKHGLHTSTFLPQVWKQIPDKNVFLEELSMKAGLDKSAWMESELSFYTVKSESE
jgi:AmmeMemoRadiSam system protein A